MFIDVLLYGLPVHMFELIGLATEVGLGVLGWYSRHLLLKVCIECVCWAVKDGGA